MIIQRINMWKCLFFFLWIKISKKLETKLMEDEVSEYYKGTEYTTKPSEELLKRYVVINSETKVTPSTAGTSWTIQESTTVSYYYKLKEFKITTEVKLHEETDEKGTTTQVKGGSISGELMNPYETVIIDQPSKKDIIMTADTGYKIKAIIIQTKADLIVAVGTGEIPYVAIAGGILMIMIAMTAGIYVIRKRH